MDVFFSSSSEDEECLILAALIEDKKQTKKCKKRKWVHKINTAREQFGEFATLIPQLQSDEKRFYLYFRMDIQCFNEILEWIENEIQKQPTHFRNPIPPAERLSIALRFYATGDSYITIGHSFRVGFTTVSNIVREVSDDIIKIIGPKYMPEPTKEIWEDSIRGFYEKWQFPNCLGSVDDKHVTIKCPPNSGSKNFCYLKKFSMVLMAIVDPDYKFICVDVGGYGRNSDGGILEKSVLGQRLEHGNFNVPDGKPLPNQIEKTPMVIIGDEAFALKPYLMKPFPRRLSRNEPSKDIFNYRLCRARRVVENAFGILTKKWRLYNRPLEIEENTAKKVVMATCILHNYLRIENTNTFDDDFNEDESLGGLGNFENNFRRGTNEAFKVRQQFVHYFNQNK